MTREDSTYQAPQLQGPPGTGGRVELRLLLSLGSSPAERPESSRESERESAAPVATYAALWATAEDTWEGELRVGADGRIQLHTGERPPPAWLTEFSTQLLRTTARTVLGGSAPWPRRLTRWRATPNAP